MVYYKNPNFLYQHIHNILAKFIVVVLKVTGIVDIESGTKVKNAKQRIVLSVLFSLFFTIFDICFTIIFIPLNRNMSLDSMLALLQLAVSRLTLIVTTLNPILKLTQIEKLYKSAIEINDFVSTYNQRESFNDDKWFVYHALIKLVFDISVSLIFVVTAVGQGLAINIDLILLFLHALTFIHHLFMLTIPITISLIIYLYAAYLSKIILIKTQRNAVQLKNINENLIQSRVWFMNESCALSDKLQHLAECYSKVDAFSKRAIKILEPSLLISCSYTFLLMINQTAMAMTIFQIGFYGVPYLQLAFICHAFNMLIYVVYGPQILLKRSEKLLVTVTSLTTRKSETRMDDKVRNI